MAEHQHGRGRRATRHHTSLRVAELVLCMLVVGVPLAIGGVHPSAILGATLGGAVALGCVLLGRGSDGVPVPAVAVALGGATFFSVVTALPLPASLAGWLSPRARLWAEFPPDPAPSWFSISLDATATWVEVARLGGVVAILIASAALARRQEAALRLVKALALAGVCVAAVSLLHLVTGVSQLYFVYPFHFGETPLTTFVNGNHAASLALISALAATGLAVSAQEVRPRLAWGVAAVVGVGLTLHSKSVAGIGSLVLALLLFAVLTTRRRASSGPLLAIGAAMSAMAAAGIALGLFGRELEAVLFESGASKLRPWGPTLRLIRDHWLTGVGRGAFASAYPPYAPPRSLTTVTHPENVVLQWVAEWGVPVALAVFGALAITLWRAWRRRSGDLSAAWQDALLAAVVGVLLHDLADFGLEFAGVGVPFAVALGVLAGRTAGSRRWRIPVWGLAGGSAACAAGAAIFALPHLAERELTALNQRQKQLDAEAMNREYRALQRRHPADPAVIIDGGNALLGRFADSSLPVPERLKAMEYALKFLMRAQELSQQDRPHLSLAWALARLGRRSQAFTELRLAYATSMTGTAIDQALTYEATPEELASFPLALARSRALSADRNHGFEPSHAAAVLIDHVAHGRKQLRTARLAAEVVLQSPQESIARTTELLDVACRVTYSDGECGRAKGHSCSLIDEVPGIGRQLIALGNEWIKDSPSEPKAYGCLASGHILLGDDVEVQRVLGEAASKFPAAVALKLFLAQWHMQQQRPAEALKALELIPGDGEASVAAGVRSTRVRALWASGQQRAARAEAEAATRLYPDAIWAHELAAGLHETNAQPDLAVQDLLNAEQLASGDERARLAAWRARLEAARSGPAPVNPEALARP